MQETKNLFIALAVTFMILWLWQIFYVNPQQEALREYNLKNQQTQAKEPARELAAGDVRNKAASNRIAAGDDEGEGLFFPSKEFEPRAELIAETQNIQVLSDKLHGSISLHGARFDNLTLANYRQSKAEGSPEVILFSPSGAEDVYFAEFGWLAVDKKTVVPDKNTVWKASSDILTPDKPVTLSWDNGQGVLYRIAIRMDENYMFTVGQSVENNGDTTLNVLPYGLINRARSRDMSFYILHEGPLGAFDGVLHETTYDDMRDEKHQKFSNVSGWLGITDKYWLTSIIPDARYSYDANFHYRIKNGQDRYQTDFVGQVEAVEPGKSLQYEQHLFAGAKKIELLDAYSDELNLELFDRAVDFGWLYFLTRPLLSAVKLFYSWAENFGVAIVMLTILVRILLYPLASKSFRSMARMKALAPELKQLRERYKDDRMKLNQEMMSFYKDRKINPLAGCLPILLQIPVFFALYKVLFVTIEMRHAPFFGWISDLSAPDPTNIFNIFGLIPWEPFSWLPMIGVWPVLFAVTMFIQQALNPPPPDPTQAMMMRLLPFILLFLFASFPAGLVIYWTCNNTLSVLQQWYIARTIKVSEGATEKAE